MSDITRRIGPVLFKNIFEIFRSTWVPETDPAKAFNRVRIYLDSDTSLDVETGVERFYVADYPFSPDNSNENSARQSKSVGNGFTSKWDYLRDFIHTEFFVYRYTTKTENNDVNMCIKTKETIAKGALDRFIQNLRETAAIRKMISNLEIDKFAEDLSDEEKKKLWDSDMLLYSYIGDYAGCVDEVATITDIGAIIVYRHLPNCTQGVVLVTFSSGPHGNEFTPNKMLVDALEVIRKENSAAEYQFLSCCCNDIIVDKKGSVQNNDIKAKTVLSEYESSSKKLPATSVDAEKGNSNNNINNNDINSSPGADGATTAIRIDIVSGTTAKLGSLGLRRSELFELLAREAIRRVALHLFIFGNKDKEFGSLTEQQVNEFKEKMPKNELLKITQRVSEFALRAYNLASCYGKNLKMLANTYTNVTLKEEGEPEDMIF